MSLKQDQIKVCKDISKRINILACAAMMEVEPELNNIMHMNFIQIRRLSKELVKEINKIGRLK